MGQKESNQTNKRHNIQVCVGNCFIQCNSFITLCFGYIRINYVIGELCYKETILQRNYRKMTIVWSFSYNSFVKFHGKKIGSHNMTVFYPNLCLGYIRINHVISESCNKGMILQRNYRKITILWSFSIIPL